VTRKRRDEKDLEDSMTIGPPHFSFTPSATNFSLKANPELVSCWDLNTLEKYILDKVPPPEKKTKPGS